MDLNNQMIFMRKDIKRAKIRVVAKLVRSIRLLRDKKGDEKQQQRSNKRADVLAEEIQCLKDVKPDVIFKFLLSSDASIDDVNKCQPVNLQHRGCVRIGLVPYIKLKMTNIKQQVEKFDTIRSKTDSITSIEITKKLTMLDKNISETQHKSSQSTNQESSQSTNQESSQSTNQESSQSINQESSDSTNQESSQSTNQESSQSTNQESSQSTNQESSQSINQESSNSTNQESSQSINQEPNHLNKPSTIAARIFSNTEISNITSDKINTKTEDNLSVNTKGTESGNDSATQNSNDISIPVLLEKKKSTKDKNINIDRVDEGISMEPCNSEDEVEYGSESADDTGSEFEVALPDFYGNCNDAKDNVKKSIIFNAAASKSDDVSSILKNMGQGYSDSEDDSTHNAQDECDDGTKGWLHDNFFVTDGNTKSNKIYNIKTPEDDDNNLNLPKTIQSTFITSLTELPKIKSSAKKKLDETFPKRRNKNHVGQRQRKKQQQQKSKTKKAKSKAAVLEDKTKDLHPSWQASQERKRKNVLQEFAGKHVRFDDSE